MYRVFNGSKEVGSRIHWPGFIRVNGVFYPCSFTPDENKYLSFEVFSSIKVGADQYVDHVLIFDKDKKFLAYKELSPTNLETGDRLTIFGGMTIKGPQ